MIECKSPKVKEANCGKRLTRCSVTASSVAKGRNEIWKLFYYNQFLVATGRQQAKFGTITTHIEKHFFRWTDPYPLHTGRSAA